MAAKTVPVQAVPEVAAYMEAEERLQQWLQVNEANLQPLRDLMEDVRYKRQAADKVVRSQGILCGPWTQHSLKVTIDTITLVDAIGPEQFLAIGGEKATQVTYTIDKKKLEMAIANGTIDKELAEKVRKESIAYSAPKDPSL